MRSVVTHSNPAAVALRSLRDGPGGGTLIVHGEPGPAARFPAGLRRRPVPTLLESVLAFVADPGGYAAVWAFTKAGPHLPADVAVGPGRLRIQQAACGWVLRGPDPAAPPPADPAGFEDMVRMATGGGAGGPGPVLERFPSSWVRAVPSLLNRVEEACGKLFQGDAYTRTPVAPAGRVLVLLDEGLLTPTTLAELHEAEASADLCRRLTHRLNALPTVARGTQTDLVVLAGSAEAADSFRSGDAVRTPFARLYQRRGLAEAAAGLAAAELLPTRVHWPDVPVVGMPRVDRTNPLAGVADRPDPTARLYDTLRTAAPAPPPADPTAELDALTGLVRVKAAVRGVFDEVRLNAALLAQGLPPDDEFWLHMVFAGNPGTGKTTVAQIVGRMYAAAGLLSGTKFTELTAADLVAGYIGQTVGKVEEAFERAAGGVLFIDEAYMLTPKDRKDFTQDVVDLMVRWMTNRRRDLAFILAGYPTKMGELLAANAGFRSRVQWVAFDDYAVEDLLDIARRKLGPTGLTVGPGGWDALRDRLARRAGDRDFANGREIDRLLKAARQKLAGRLFAPDRPPPTRDELATLLPEDIRAATL